MVAAEVFRKLRSDFKKTIKPYPGPLHIWHDFAQPYYGCKNIVFGIGYFFQGLWQRNPSKIAYSGAVFLRGWIRVLTFALNWFLRMPLRLILTAVKGYQRAEHSRSVQRLVVEAEKLIPAFVKHNHNCHDLDSTIILYRHLQKEFPNSKRPKISPVLNAMVDYQQELVAAANEITRDIVAAYERKKTLLPTDIAIDPLPDFTLSTVKDHYDRLDYSALQFCISLFSRPSSHVPPLPPRTAQFSYSPD